MPHGYDSINTHFGHKLVDLVSVVSGYGKMVRNTPGVPDRAVRFNDLILEGAERIRDLSEKILGLPGVGPIATEPVRVADCIHQAVARVQPRLTGKHQLLLDVPEDLPLGLCGQGSLIRSLYYVLENAVDATVEGGHIRIRARADDRAGTIGIELMDTGQGMDADVLAPRRSPSSRRTRTTSRTPGSA